MTLIRDNNMKKLFTLAIMLVFTTNLLSADRRLDMIDVGGGIRILSGLTNSDIVAAANNAPGARNRVFNDIPTAYHAQLAVFYADLDKAIEEGNIQSARIRLKYLSLE